MIKLGIRDYIISYDPIVTSDRIVAYDEYDKEIPFTTDMSSYINSTVACIHFSTLGQIVDRYYAVLKSISVKRDPYIDLDTWEVQLSVLESTRVKGGATAL